MSSKRGGIDSRELSARRLLLSMATVAALATAVILFVLRPASLEPNSSAPVPVQRVSDDAIIASPAAGAWQLPPNPWGSLPSADPLPSQLAELASNPINDVRVVSLGSDCPGPEAPREYGRYQELVTQQWECLQNAFHPVLASAGASTDEAAVEFFSGTGADSECGRIEAPAFYCSAGDGTVYFGTEHFRMAQEWDLSINEMVNHEYGHHLQHVFGITAGKAAAEGEDLDRRMELQAICWSAGLTYQNRAVGFDATDYQGWQERLDAMVASDIHGARGSLEEWGMRGLWASNLGDCNTWAAPADRVS